jgi:hypothetical protein
VSQLLQANLNRFRRVQDLMFQNRMDHWLALTVVAESHRVPEESQGAGDLDNSVAIF